MGQKVHPEGFRLGVKRKGEKVDFKSSWYSDRDFAELLGEDLKIRVHIEKKLSRAGIANITIRKAAEQGEVAVDVHTARPGHRLRFQGGRDPDGTDRGEGLDQPRDQRRRSDEKGTVADAGTQEAKIQKAPPGPDAGPGQGR